MPARCRPAWPIRNDELDGLLGRLEGLSVALAVSGGPDSMALMHLVARWLELPHNRAVSPLTGRPLVLTVDHGLRPESAAEAAFVATEAAKLGFPHRTLLWNRPTQYPTVMQAEARDARYSLLAREITPMRAPGRPEPILVTAHHADDQAETVLMRLARGSGLDGLSGMRPVRTHHTTTSDGSRLAVTLVRPLLGVPSIRLRDTLEEARLPWCEDPSNTDDKYERVRVRRALDVLADLSVDLRAIVTSAARLGRARAGYLDLIAQGPLRAIDWHAGLMAESDLAPFASDVRVRVLTSLLLTCGGATRPARLAQIEALTDRMTHGAIDETLGGCRVVATKEGILRVYREIGRGLPTVALAPGDAKPWDGGRFTVALAADCPQPAVSVGALGAEGWAGLKRAVPGLADLRLPAAAVAGLPAFRSADGALLAVPTLDELLLRSGTDDSRRAWRELVGAPAGACSVRFTGAERLHREIS